MQLLNYIAISQLIALPPYLDCRNTTLLRLSQYCKQNNHFNNKNNKNIFNKNGGRCRDVKTQKAWEQGWVTNVGPKIKQTTFI